MSIKEPRHKTGYWENELESLGVKLNRRNELNDSYELQALADNLKEGYYQNYKLAYSH
jgi:hypothetical protein